MYIIDPVVYRAENFNDWLELRLSLRPSVRHGSGLRSNCKADGSHRGSWLHVPIRGIVICQK
jgi:hypothetical protein